MDNKNSVAFFEKSAFNYNSSFQDKKKIAELSKEVERLKAELEKGKQLNDNHEYIEEDIRVISSIDDFAMLICERLSIEDRLKLIAVLNQDIKKQQNPVKNQSVDLDKTAYVAKRIVKSKPSKKAALINAIKTMFQDDMTENEIEEIIIDLQKRNFIKIVESKITYR